MGAYIPDGQTVAGYIAEERNGASVLWDACRFKYRPATAPEVEALALTGSLANVEQKRVKFLKAHLVEWDLKHEGEILDISEEVLGRLYHGFRTNLINVVAGTWHSDPEPGAASPPAKVNLMEQAGN